MMMFSVDVKKDSLSSTRIHRHTDKVMEILNNVQLEGRRINVEISKNDGGGRRDHNWKKFWWWKKFSPREGNFAPRRFSGGFRSDRNAQEGGLAVEFSST
jgi:ATP-dependent RNA helicase DeaD